METRQFTWSGTDDDTRIEHASVQLRSSSMHAVGAASARDFSSSWELDVADGWITRALRVTSRGFGWSRSLELIRSPEGVWSAECNSRGEADLPAPGAADGAALDGAVDCDLGLCPLTNTMPIRRLGLLGRHVDETPLVMAWVEMPSLRVLRSDQLYASGRPGDLATVEYSSAGRDFRAELTVDSDGFVVDYPGLARRDDRGIARR